MYRYAYCPSPCCILSLHHYARCLSPFCILSLTLMYTVLHQYVHGVVLRPLYHVFSNCAPLPLPSAYLLLPLRLLRPSNSSIAVTTQTLLLILPFLAFDYSLRTSVTLSSTSKLLVDVQKSKLWYLNQSHSLGNLKSSPSYITTSHILLAIESPSSWTNSLRSHSLLASKSPTASSS